MTKAIFVIGTVYQLLNAIVIRMKEKKNQQCDLFLKSSTLWEEEILIRLKEEKLFGNIYCPNLTQIEKDFADKDDEFKARMVKDPMLFFGEAPVELLYDEMFCGTSGIVSKLLYRYHVMNDKKPDIFMIEDGILSYTHNYGDLDSLPYLQNEYAKARFSDAIKAIYLYKPEVYSAIDTGLEFRKIPAPDDDFEIKQLLIKVFGKNDLPEEEFIYFEDYYFANDYIANDLELFQETARAIGRDNVVVKRHPRSKYDRYTVDGWKVMRGTRTPWEIQLMTENVGSKVFISVSSTAALSLYTIFGIKTHVISLEKMYVGIAFLNSTPGFATYMEKVTKCMNSDKVFFHTPATKEELYETIRYIKMEQMIGAEGENNRT